jgi:hypothetical protein
MHPLITSIAAKTGTRRRRGERRLRFSVALARDFQVLVGHSAGSERRLLHLIREGAEASLCGIARSSLGQGDVAPGIVCPDCIEWLPKRLALSDRLRKVEKPNRGGAQAAG